MHVRFGGDDLLVKLQRNYLDHTSIIMEGRDIGSVVFPDTPFKIYIDAHEDVRASRRSDAGEVDSIAARDAADSERVTAPLIVADGAVILDPRTTPSKARSMPPSKSSNNKACPNRKPPRSFLERADSHELGLLAGLDDFRRGFPHPVRYENRRWGKPHHRRTRARRVQPRKLSRSAADRQPLQNRDGLPRPQDVVCGDRQMALSEMERHPGRSGPPGHGPA